MDRVDRSKLKDILHEYKKERYFYEHELEGHPEHEVVARDTQRMVAEILAQNFHFELNKPLDPASAETLGMIENYIRNAALPPVLTKVVERLMIIEKRQQAGVRFLEQLIGLIEESEHQTAN